MNPSHRVNPPNHWSRSEIFYSMGHFKFSIRFFIQSIKKSENGHDIYGNLIVLCCTFLLYLIFYIVHGREPMKFIECVWV